jgi:two-component system, chemotaxis family, response regulator WspF
MRVGIVNDQRLATEALRRVVSSDPNLKIAWTAVDGQEAVDKCAQDLPDVVLMDLVMPVMNGAEATREIMSHSPCPVLVVTATVSGNYALVCEALSHGAYDAVCTPTLGDCSPAEAGANLLAKLKSVDRIRREVKVAPRPPSDAQSSHATPPFSVSEQAPLVAIGASTGGPQALEQILSAWPAEFPASVVVVQHIAEEFAASLAQWLHERSKVEVRPAVPGDALQPGVVLVGATNDHLVMRNDRRLVYRAEPESSPYRPSVDTLFESLDQHWPNPAVAVVLTGIGRDGATGLLKLRQRGWHTVTQDEESSVVYGMPMAAAEIGAAKRILPLGEIAAHIAGHVRRMV